MARLDSFHSHCQLRHYFASQPPLIIFDIDRYAISRFSPLLRADFHADDTPQTYIDYALYYAIDFHLLALLPPLAITSHSRDCAIALTLRRFTPFQTPMP
jgi:hypothetical protein